MDSIEYIRKAKSNEVFLADLEAMQSQHYDWRVTVCFYIAVHYMNAHLASTIRGGFCTHEKVKTIAHPESSFVPARVSEKAFTAYLKLQNLSRQSRYLMIGDDETTKLIHVRDKHLINAQRWLTEVKTFVGNKHSALFTSV